ncbi:unnamed protein product [Meganyctiphanes norvegica]|uniref:Cuticle protein n=1 Tax=Meganyctiphanes norvegica TaxID=48144 RepID=A0AAV2SAW9_MEGNR
MKVVLAILAFAAAAQAAPHTILGGAAISIDGGYPYTDALGFNIPNALPLTYSHTPLAYSHLPAISPLTYSHFPAVAPAYAPLTYAVAPAVHPGYVAKTPGATHIAPLPAGIGYASHHINLASAPGTE